MYVLILYITFKEFYLTIDMYIYQLELVNFEYKFYHLRNICKINLVEQCVTRKTLLFFFVREKKLSMGEFLPLYWADPTQYVLVGV